MRHYEQPCIPCSEDGVFDCVREKSPMKWRGVCEGPSAAAQAFSFENEPSPRTSSSSWVNSEGVPLSTPDVALTDVGDSPFPSTDQDSPTFPRKISLPEFDTPYGLRPPEIGQTSGAEPMPFRGVHPNPTQPITIPAISFLPSLWFSYMPPPLPTPLSSLGSENFQFSNATSSELDMASWVLPFPRGHTQASQG